MPLDVDRSDPHQVRAILPGGPHGRCDPPAGDLRIVVGP